MMHLDVVAEKTQRDASRWHAAAERMPSHVGWHDDGVSPHSHLWPIAHAVEVVRLEHGGAVGVGVAGTGVGGAIVVGGCVGRALPQRIRSVNTPGAESIASTDVYRILKLEAHWNADAFGHHHHVVSP